MNRNLISASLALAMLLFVLGCNCNVSDWISQSNGSGAGSASGQGTADANANKTVVEKAGETVFGTEKTGIRECDELIALFEQQMTDANSGGDYATQAMRELIKQQIYSQLREGLSNSSPAEKAQMGKQCELALGQLKAGNSNMKN